VCASALSEKNMTSFPRTLLTLALLLSAARFAHAGNVQQTIEVFRHAGESAAFFDGSYAYAVFPTIGAGAVGVGGAYGKGRVFVGGKPTGTAVMKQISLGFQLGGKSYSEIIFFEDARALEEFESGKFEFGADASVIAVTAGANAQVATNGVGNGYSEGQHDAATQGSYQVGMAVFIVAKGGLMASAAVAGQRFEFKPLPAAAVK
jgi:lipid-binding SYLF domain-containing protein